MASGSVIAMLGPGGQMVGDPEVVQRSREADALRAQMAVQAQARRDAEAIRFSGPYIVLNSVA